MANPNTALDLTPDQSERLWDSVLQLVAAHPQRLRNGRATPAALDPAVVRSNVGAVDLERACEARQAVEHLAEGLYEHQVHPPHPRYFGLFNPAATEAGVAGDALTALFNPNVAAWSHSPFATEIEQRLIRELGALFGFEPSAVHGTFAAGGMEANHTAVLTALSSSFPRIAEAGLRGLDADPVFYVSAECHHSFHRAARVCGLGSMALRAVPVDDQLRMDAAALSAMIEADAAAGLAPFLVVGTAGTTNAGAIDPLEAVGTAARKHGVWFHVDAAWAGAATLHPRWRQLLAGCEKADSVTIDAHKWFSAPMGAGVFLTTRRGALDQAFRVDNPYMPREADGAAVVDQYQQGLQWSRRFIGLKLWLSLRLHGWEGYRAAVERMQRVGDYLQDRLLADGWHVLNDTPLPIVCFAASPDSSESELEAIRAAVFASGEAWISTTRLGGRQVALRACVTNFRTNEQDVDRLAEYLQRARRLA